MRALKLILALTQLMLLPTPVAAVNVVSIDIAKVSPDSLVTRRNLPLTRRATIQESLVNNSTGGSYMASVSVGTPGQDIQLVIDTGSSDVFILDYIADQCTQPRLQRKYGACYGGLFDPTKSSTFKTVSKGGFSITYADNTGSKGDYISDNLQIAGATVKSLQMGLAINLTTAVGIMGIGYSTNEASRTQYPNFIDQMVTQGLINTKAYSLWLNDLDASTGSILFGGIDSAKYVGSLIALPIQQNTRGAYKEFNIAMTGLTVVSGGQSNTITNSTFAEPVILDSGTTFTYLPDDIVSNIVNLLGGIKDPSGSGLSFVDCGLLSTDAGTTFDYSFGGNGGPVIKVPIDELIIPIDQSYSGDLPFANSCVFGILGSSESGVNLLGDTFLRSAYVVYDLLHNQVAMAQTNFNATSSNIVEISASDSTLPLVSGVASQVSVAQTATGIPGIGRTSAANTATSTPRNTHVSVGTATTTSSGAATAVASSKAAALGRVPAFELGGLLVLAASGAFALAGGWMTMR